MAGIVAMPQGPAPDKHKSLAGAPMNVPTGKKPMPWLCAGTENEVAVLTITLKLWGWLKARDSETPVLCKDRSPYFIIWKGTPRSPSVSISVPLDA